MPQPPESITLDWCDRCGRTNRHKSLKVEHYYGGTRCSGRLYSIVYTNSGKVEQ